MFFFFTYTSVQLLFPWFCHKLWLKIEAADSSELLVIMYQITRHYIPEANRCARWQPKRGAKTAEIIWNKALLNSESHKWKDFSENYPQFGHKPAMSKSEKDERISVLRSADMYRASPGCENSNRVMMMMMMTMMKWWKQWVCAKKKLIVWYTTVELRIR